MGQWEEGFGFVVRKVGRRLWSMSNHADDEDEQCQAQDLAVADKDAQLVGEEAEVVLDRVSWSRECRSARHGLLHVDRVPETNELDARDANAHGPAHTFDRDFPDSASKFVVFDLTVVVVVTGVDHGYFLCAQMLDNVLRDQWSEDILILVARL